MFATPNYRLGIFGFSGGPGLPQNAALRDHRAVVECVRDTIAGFGGDPSRVTLFGQSAGGSPVDYYACAWQHRLRSWLVQALRLCRQTEPLRRPMGFIQPACLHLPDRRECGRPRPPGSANMAVSISWSVGQFTVVQWHRRA